MNHIYFKLALKNKLQQWYLIALIVALPIIFGTAYGIMYQNLFATTSASSQNTPTLFHSVVTILSIPNPLNAIGKMQLSVFTGCTFFIVSLFASQFVKNRKNQFTNRLVAMGYQKKNVFFGEGISYFIISLIVVIAFNALFMIWHGITLPQNIETNGRFFVLLILQGLFASAYALFALGTFKNEKVFSLFHFLPAFVIAFLGGSFFPVDQVATSGLYEWMPTYYLNKIYTQFYTLNIIDGPLFTKAVMAFAFCILLLTVIGYRLFQLEEVAS